MQSCRAYPDLLNCAGKEWQACWKPHSIHDCQRIYHLGAGVPVTASKVKQAGHAVQQALCKL